MIPGFCFYSFWEGAVQKSRTTAIVLPEFQGCLRGFDWEEGIRVWCSVNRSPLQLRVGCVCVACLLRVANMEFMTLGCMWVIVAMARMVPNSSVSQYENDD